MFCDACRTRTSNIGTGQFRRAWKDRVKSDICVQMVSLVAKAARVSPKGIACFVRKDSVKTMFIKPHPSPSSCVSASFCLASVHVHSFFSLQAVETNLASKDSHWVFVNEVRAPEW